MTYAPTGGIVAAPTTSLPEALGGVRNWDYRYCWIRDAVLTLGAFMRCGYAEEALAFRDWMLRAAAGRPRDLRIMYGIAGERRLPEEELDWLPGYEGSSPVRIGNGAAEQFQLDVYGELADAGYLARSRGGWSRAARSTRCRTASCIGAATSCWRRSRSCGRSPTKASGRSAGRAATSPTRR